MDNDSQLAGWVLVILCVVGLPIIAVCAVTLLLGFIRAFLMLGGV